MAIFHSNLSLEKLMAITRFSSPLGREITVSWSVLTSHLNLLKTVISVIKSHKVISQLSHQVILRLSVFINYCLLTSVCSWVLFCQSQRGRYTAHPPCYTAWSFNFIYNAELSVLMVCFNSSQSTPSFPPLPKFTKNFCLALSFPSAAMESVPEGGSASLGYAYLAKLQFL